MTRHVTYIDDNYGVYDIEDQSDLNHYHETQRKSVRKRCVGCNRTVRILPQYAYCNSCATKREQGYDI